ncbi:hypothetical protein Tco_1177806 [Tanacetum coccineum]
MQEVILFYKGLDVPTRHVLDSKGSDTSDGLDAIQAQLNNLSREIKKEEGKTLKEAYYTQYGVPFPQGGRYMAAALGFYQRDNGNPSYQERRKFELQRMLQSRKNHVKSISTCKEVETLSIRRIGSHRYGASSQ